MALVRFVLLLLPKERSSLLITSSKARITPVFLIVYRSLPVPHSIPDVVADQYRVVLKLPRFDSDSSNGTTRVDSVKQMGRVGGHRFLQYSPGSSSTLR